MGIDNRRAKKAESPLFQILRPRHRFINIRRVILQCAESVHERLMAHPCPHIRGKGAELLDWVIAEARAEQKRTLRLWTTNEPEYAKATALYQTRGFRSEIWPALPGETWQTLVFSLGLDGQPPTTWAQRSPQHELCGREAPQLVAA